MSKDAKLIRGQARQIIKEILPEMLKEELTKAIFTQLSADANIRLTNIEQSVRETLVRLDDRSKEIMAYLVRQSASNVFAPVPEPIAETEGEKSDEEDKGT